MNNEGNIIQPIKLAATDTCSQKSLSDVMSNFVDNLQSNLPVSKQGKFLSIIKALDSCLKSKNSSLQKLKDHVNKYILDVYGPSYTKIKKCGSIATSQGKKCSDSSVLNCIYDKFKNTTTSYQYEDLLKRINYKKGEYTCLKGNMTEILKFPSSIN
uniref:DUF4806 domain-containing protein n=1 Tax=Heterorhabditis bacteriophora TaxID=37862 RepID=A0A1I7X8E4_HETBA